ncbi:MAG: hypothetical protein JNL67_04195 [Planctomycetaceae bacterium]|nr:hypothetical protein [Planctomycetaceae bacterium]
MGDRHQANATLATETRWHWGQTPYPTILHSLAEANAFVVSILEKPLKELETSANPANKAEVAELTVQLRLLRRSVV